ncbi:hypothetical protein CkaCkLH20_10011 [Colletotrichum karsti]|uniref:Non-homologous end-joining factor 1 n=1 Tax=Colletotrichum karsti TaxID=1095194 RepID=A0A9P6HY16_9PEZI|nr:uncharacterized protein CkaCkLH20_10011 [Colletotrichum karsti]KAF9872514.1 hypothetical protein CkaCkLH20_10011 [Colletotrichum karsti]
MTTPPVWRPLPPAPGLPSLLVSTTFSTTAYTIHLTDLSSIWAETMDRKAILQRSLNESTSIDPTDGPRNMRAFLSKIRSVFDVSHEDHDKASMTLSAAPSREAGEDGLTMRITCELENMQPLEWPVYLQRCPQSRLATELVLPITQANSVKTRQIDSLLAIIKQKDIVITKLLDKLEANGTRLENVFTVLSAKQKPTRQMAEEKVKGLAPLRPDEWKAQLGSDEADMATVLQDVFGASGLEYRPQTDAEDLVSDNWWAKTEGSPIPIVVPKSASSQEPPMATSSGPQNERSDDKDTMGGNPAADEDDDFQVQSTPPHLMSTRNRPAAAATKTAVADADESTEDEDVSQVPDSVPAPPQDRKSQPTRLGMTGQKRQPTPSPPPAPQGSKPGGSETETESEDDASASRAEPSSPPKQSVPERTRTSRSGLGQIGGGKRRSVSPEPLEKAESPKKGGLGRIGGAKRHSKSPEPPKKVGLGRIGGGARPSKTPEPVALDAEDRGRHRSEVKQPEKPRETSQERADKKRNELEKELQRKAASGPARKKRKF